MVGKCLENDIQFIGFIDANARGLYVVDMWSVLVAVLMVDFCGVHFSLYNKCSKLGVHVPSSLHYQVFEEFKIKYVLNMTPLCPNYFESDSIRYKRIAVMDTGSQKMSNFFNEAFDFIG